MDEVAPEFWQGIAQFNQRQFYACHDTLEAIWMEAAEPQRTFYQGILQVAVGLYHLSNHNWRGAVILLGEGMNRLRRYEPDYGGVDLSDFLRQTAALMGTLQQAGPEQAAVIWQALQSSVQEAANDPERLEAVEGDRPEHLQFPVVRRIHQSG